MDEQDLNNQPTEKDFSASEQPVPEGNSDKVDETKQEKKEPDIVFQVSGNFTLIDEAGKEIESGPAKFVLDEEKISILSEDGKATPLFLKDIGDFFVQDYKINLSLFGGGKAIISELSYQHEDFVKALTKLRHEIIQKNLLMQEGGKKAGFRGNYDYQKDGEKRNGGAEIEIYDTGLVIKPDQGDLFRIPFAEITDFSKKDYNISIITDFTTLLLSQFGEKFDALSKAIEGALNELSLKTQLILKELLPELDPLIIKKASELLKDGRAASKNEIEKISTRIWSILEKKLVSLGIQESYDFLRTLSKTGEVFIGIKRDLMGDLTGEYIWFLMPVVSEKGGEFLAMEAASTIEGGGKATYFFKIPEGEDTGDLVKKVNRCMLAINFRREPIYLSDEDLEKPDYSKYKIAIAGIPELKILRQLFVGRVAHQENWKENVNNLISKNF